MRGPAYENTDYQDIDRGQLPPEQWEAPAPYYANQYADQYYDQPPPYRHNIIINNGNHRAKGAVAWLAAVACAVGVSIMNADIHLNDPVNKAKAGSAFKGLDVRSPSGYIGMVPMYALGRGEKDTIGNNPYAVTVADTKVGLYFPDMAKLSYDWQEESLRVTQRGEDGSDNGITIGDLVMEPLLGQVCDSKDSAGARIFVCQGVDPTGKNYVGRYDIDANSRGLLSSDSDVIDESMKSLRLFLTDKYCLEEYIFKPQGIDFSWSLRSAVRQYLWANYGIPPSVVNFNMGELRLNPSNTTPVSQRLAEAHAHDKQVVSPFDSKTTGTKLDQWCSLAGIDGYNNNHPFIDTHSLMSYIDQVKMLGGESVKLGVFPDGEGGTLIDEARDQQRRGALPNEFKNKQIALF